MILNAKFILGLLLISIFAHADISAGLFKSVPDEKDLSDQFKSFHNQDRMTQWGGSCHVFSAVYLVEAACKKITGKEITISPYYYYNRHISEQLNDVLYYETEKEHVGLITSIDAGRPEKTLDRILKSPACLSHDTRQERKIFSEFQDLVEGIESEFGSVAKRCTFPADKKYIPQAFEDFSELSQEDKKIEILKRKVRAADEAIADYRALNVIARGFARDTYNQATENRKTALAELEKTKSNAQAEAKKQICEVLNNQMVCYLGDQVVASTKGGLVRKTPSENAELKACLDRGLKYKKEKFSVDRGLQLLSQDKPFLCLGAYQQNGVVGAHVAAVVGYKKDLTKVDGVDWRLRDSLLSSPGWGWDMSKNCSEIIYIDI